MSGTIHKELGSWRGRKSGEGFVRNYYSYLYCFPVILIVTLSALESSIRRLLFCLSSHFEFEEHDCESPPPGVWKLERISPLNSFSINENAGPMHF